MPCRVLTNNDVFRWKGMNRSHQPVNWVQIERKRHDKVKHTSQILFIEFPLPHKYNLLD